MSIRYWAEKAGTSLRPFTVQSTSQKNGKIWKDVPKCEDKPWLLFNKIPSHLVLGLRCLLTCHWSWGERCRQGSSLVTAAKQATQLQNRRTLDNIWKLHQQRAQQLYQGRCPWSRWLFSAMLGMHNWHQLTSTDTCFLRSNIGLLPSRVMHSWSHKRLESQICGTLPSWAGFHFSQPFYSLAWTIAVRVSTLPATFVTTSSNIISSNAKEFLFPSLEPPKRGNASDGSNHYDICPTS